MAQLPCASPPSPARAMAEEIAAALLALEVELGTASGVARSLHAASVPLEDVPGALLGTETSG